MTDLMTAFPPHPEVQVTLANWRTGPYPKWAFHHVRELVPSAEIRHDPNGIKRYIEGTPLAPPPLDGPQGEIDFDLFCEITDLDGLVVLHQGRLIFETYRNGMDHRAPHICMSISKSMLGLLAGILADQGVLDTSAKAEAYVPELTGSAFEGATVRDLLDMRAGLDFSEDYEANAGRIVQYRKSTLWNPLEPGETALDLRSFLAGLTDKKAPHGGRFDYMSPCTDVLGWIVERAAGTPYPTVFSELFWSRIGAEDPAYITVDRLGAPRAAGGVCMTTRDLARIGQLMVEDGAGIVPAAWIRDIAENGDTDAWDQGSMAKEFPGIPMHYRSKWYTMRGRRPLLMCIGIHGQYLFVDRAKALVMAKHASSPDPSDMAGMTLSRHLFEAIRDGL